MSDRWSGADHWERSGDPLLTLDALLARSRVVTLWHRRWRQRRPDGAGRAGPRARHRPLAGLNCHCWVKRSVLELRKSEAPRLEGFRPTAT